MQKVTTSQSGVLIAVHKRVRLSEKNMRSSEKARV